MPGNRPCSRAIDIYALVRITAEMLLPQDKCGKASSRLPLSTGQDKLAAPVPPSEHSCGDGQRPYLLRRVSHGRDPCRGVRGSSGGVRREGRFGWRDERRLPWEETSSEASVVGRRLAWVNHANLALIVGPQPERPCLPYGAVTPRRRATQAAAARREFARIYLESGG